MKEILNHLFQHNTLSKSEATEVLKDISKEKYNEHQVAAFISIFQMRSISVDELAGFRDAMLELSTKPSIDFEDAIDLCGTGGDGKNTFNISTLTAFVLAAMNKKVIKHGNYGVSSVCGSSNVLEQLGYKFTNDGSKLQRQLDTSNLCFLHAPLFHPAMKFVAPIRKQMGVKTFFNMLGPLVNPLQPNMQSVGVFSLKLQRIYNHLFQGSNKAYSIVFDLEGYDEVSLTGTSKVITKNGESLVKPESFGTIPIMQESIFGGNTVQEAANIFLNVLDNRCPKEHLEVVAANSAIALSLYSPNIELKQLYHQSKETIESGLVRRTFDKLLAASSS